jgi:archaellum biogenesis ATPase FlaH
MIENTILSGLVFNEDYTRRVLPFIRDEYFDDKTYRLVFSEINSYVTKYNGLPTKEALRISVDERNDLNEDNHKQVVKVIDSLEYDPKTDEDWLVDKTEAFCQDKAIYNAVRRSILVLDGQEKKLDKGAIPQLLSDALAVSFDSSIGHDYSEDFLERYEFYHTKEHKVPFDLELFNKITKGGISRKSLTIALAGTGVGKTLFMTHCAAANYMAGKNVLYITMEMAEERISERIDANLLDLTIDELKAIPKDVFTKRIERVKAKTTGKLLVKEYPTASAGSANFRHLVNELRMKKNFHPDIIYIDYLNICISSRLRSASNVNSYTYIKTIAEELRGLAVELNVPIVSATQTTRSGFCLDPNTIVQTTEGNKRLGDVNVGDLVKSDTCYNTVKTVFPKSKKRVFKIRTETGKEIICSEDHLFPTKEGEKNLKNGLSVGDYLYVSDK